MFGAYSEGKTVKPIPRKVNITKVTSKSNAATLTWDKVNGASGYRIYYKTSADGEWKYLK